MNILLVSHDLSVTGAPKVLLWVAKYLVKHNHNIDLWTISDGALLTEYQALNITPKFVKNDRTVIRNTFKEQDKQYDLIICNTIISYKFVDVLQRFNVPVMWYLHESGYLEDMVASNRDMAKVIKNFYNIYTVSQYAKNVISKYNHNVRVIPNSVEDTFTDFHYLQQKIAFGYIGTISELKGVDILIEAFTRLAKQYNNIELYLAGNNNVELGKKLQQFTQAYSNIKWLGEIKNQAKEQFWNNINVLCAPSVYDSCSLSVLEAAMKGKAIITTNTNGANYIIQNEKNGFIISPRNETLLYKSMESIIKNADFIGTMQKFSREMYLKHASIKNQEKSIDKMLVDNKDNYPIVNTPIKYRLFDFFYKEKTSTHKIYHIGKFKIKIKRKQKRCA